MFQFVVNGEGPDAPRTPRTVLCRNIPFVIGRGEEADLQVTAAGVWDRHAEIVFDAGCHKLRVQPCGDAVLLVDGERSTGEVLLPGARLQLGAVELLVSLSPVNQAGLRRTERVVWCFLGAVVLAEILLLLALK